MYKFSPNLCQEQQAIIPNHLSWNRFTLSTCINNDRYLIIWNLAKVNLNYTYFSITFLIFLNCGHSFWNPNHNVPPCTPLFPKDLLFYNLGKFAFLFGKKKNLKPFLNPFI
jgi:hypothetical protein